jgi:hypothetical protein
VAAPVFARVMQQVLAYMNVPHDVELQDARRAQLIAKAKTADLSEGSPDYIATAAPDTDHSLAQQQVPAATEKVPARPAATVEPTPSRASIPETTPAVIAASEPPSHGTVVLSTGDTVVVPDFRGKPLRTALDEADSAGIELEISGSGVGRDQSPEPGARISPGGRVTVRFGH